MFLLRDVDDRCVDVDGGTSTSTLSGRLRRLTRAPAPTGAAALRYDRLHHALRCCE